MGSNRKEFHSTSIDMVFILFELFAVHTTYYPVIDAAKQTSFIWKVCDFFGVV